MRKPAEQVLLSGPVIFAVGGTTDRMAEPSVCCTMVNEAVTELPVVRSVARI